MFNVGDLVIAKLTIDWQYQTQWKMAHVREVKSYKIVVQIAGFGGMEGIEEWSHPGAMYGGRTLCPWPRELAATKRWPHRTRYTMLEVL
jgi:hypothetical protein